MSVVFSETDKGFRSYGVDTYSVNPLYTNGFFLLVRYKKTWDSAVYIFRGVRL